MLNYLFFQSSDLNWSRGIVEPFLTYYFFHHFWRILGGTDNLYWCKGSDSNHDQTKKKPQMKNYTANFLISRQPQSQLDKVVILK